MNLANKISIFRILLVPGIVASLVYYDEQREVLRFLALGLFILGIATDAIDGFVARTQNQQSQLGTLLDPVADKFLILGTLISLSAIRGLPQAMQIPAWFNLVVISRDVLLLSGAALLFMITGRWSVRPSRLGKWTTALQMLVVLSVLLEWPLRDPLVILVALLTVLSGISYLRAGISALD